MPSLKACKRNALMTIIIDEHITSKGHNIQFRMKLAFEEMQNYSMC